MQSVLVAEDDLHFTAPRAFDYFCQNIPAHFDLFLSGISWGDIKADHTVADFSGTMFYLVHHKFFNTFLSLSKIKWPVSIGTLY